MSEERTGTPQPNATEEQTYFYSSSVAEVFGRLESGKNGLSADKIEKIREKLGPECTNELEEDEEGSLVMQFLEKFTDPMVVLLLISAGISILLGQWDDAFSIILAVVIVSVVGFVQEYKSEKAVSALKDFVAHHCIAVRDGQQVDIPAAELVPGDVVALSPGVRVPADIRIFESNGLSVNESLLTGEPEPRSKTPAPLKNDAQISLAERSNMAYMGTAVASGTGLGVVVAIGKDTELARIGDMLREKDSKTPLQLSMDQFGKQLSAVSIATIVVIAALGLIQGKPAMQMFNMAVSLIVAAIPEGLPIAVTVTLALGVTRMSKRNAIVRKLPAVEALGATNVICVDKTGTLTQNQMTAQEIYTNRTIAITHERVCPFAVHVPSRPVPTHNRARTDLDDNFSQGFLAERHLEKRETLVMIFQFMPVSYPCLTRPWGGMKRV